jgi:hypothetical protein
MNRISAQRLTAALRRRMREEQRQMARSLLYQGETKAEVARQVGLSPSRISALFKGQRFPTKRLMPSSSRVRIRQDDAALKGEVCRVSSRDSETK